MARKKIEPVVIEGNQFTPQDDTSFDFGANVKEEAEPPKDVYSSLPVFGQVVPKGAGRLNLQSEAQRRSVEAAKTSAAIAAGETPKPKKKPAAERTIPIPIIKMSLDGATRQSRVMRQDDAIDGVMNVLNAAKKKGSAEDITEKLTDSLRMAKMSESGETPILDTQNPETEEEEDIQMAAKKKTAKKKSSKQTVNASNGSKKVKVAAPVGRERKLLLRLSKEEYEALQAKAAKQETSMANLLRTSALG